MTDFSQNGEQKIITEYFTPGEWGYLVGTFLDVGSNDGELLSNSRMLALMGWYGCCVEPAPVAYAKLATLYDKDLRVKTVNAAITTQDGPIEFYDSGTHLHKGDTSLLSTTHPETLARWKRSGEQFTKTTVRGITFETLMKETASTHFDFISIDAEGADLDILRQMDLTALGCRMLCVETNWNDAPFVEYAASHGMRLLRKCVENAIFVR